MPSIIRQIVTDDEFGTQNIRMIVTSNERGPQGEQGEPGDAATIQAGQAYSVNPGQNPQVINTGTSSAAVFDFYIPKGEKGERGEPGPAGKDAIWGDITGTLSDQTDLQNALDAKQNELIPGNNIQINGDTISATDTTYTAGTGLELEDNEFSVDTASVQEKLTAGSNITISGTTISATDTTYTAGSGLDLDGTEFSVDTDTIQGKLTAGSNVQINGNTISATDTTYSAGNAITIDSGNNNAINAAIEPPDFFASTASTVSGTGSSMTISNTAGLGISDVQLKGDTTQQTYSGKNLFNPNTPLTKAINDTNLTAVPIPTGVRIVAGTTYTSNAYAAGVFLVGKVSDYIGNTLTFTTNATTSSTNDCRVYIGTCNSSGDSRSQKANQAGTTGDNNFSVSWNVTSDSNEYICIVLYSTANKPQTVGDYVDYKNAQLEIGPATTYEPYVGGIPAPNPDYPQTVNTVTGRQMVEIYNKNLFNKDLPLSNKYIDGSGAWVSGNTPAYINQEYNMVGGDQITISFSNKVGGGYVRVAQYTEDGIFIHRDLVSTSPTTITLQSNTAKVAWSVDKSGSLYFNNLQIEMGSTATSYQSHQSYEVNLGKNLFDKNNANLLNAYIGANSHSIVDDASSASVYIPCEPNTTYTISKLADNVFRAGTSNTTPANGVVLSDYVANNTSNYITLTSGSSARFLVIFIYNSSSSHTSTEILDSLQIELGSTATTYAPYFTPIELCKLSSVSSAPTILNYQDYIYKSSSDWYIHKATEKLILDGDEAWETHNLHNGIYSFVWRTSGAGKSNSAVLASSYRPVYVTTYNSDSNRSYGMIATLEYGASGTQENVYMTAPNSSVTTLQQFETWLGTNPVTVYCALATATDTQITNADLIAQLNALAGATTYDGQTIFTVTSENQLAILNAETYRKSLAGIIAAIKEA